MRNYVEMAKKYSLYTAILIVIFLVLAIYLDKRALFLGLALGSVFSLINLLFTYFQVKRVINSVKTGKNKMSFGTVTRMISALIPVMIATQYDHVFSIVGVIIGLMVTYAMILIEPIFHIRTHK